MRLQSLPGFKNFDPNHRSPDGEYPDVDIIHAEYRQCQILKDHVHQLSAVYERSAGEQDGKKQEGMPESDEGLSYYAHMQDLKEKLDTQRVKIDPSRLDRMIAIRMRVTGYTQEEIKVAISENIKFFKAPEDQESYDWNDYAARIVRFAFGPIGDEQVILLNKYKNDWLVLEGRPIPDPEPMAKEQDQVQKTDKSWKMEV